jgi:ABC-type multidrug transport system fused ATPase/permease subunit
LTNLLKNIIAILTRQERSRLYLLVAADAIMSLLDIAALVMLLFVINFYTRPQSDLLLHFLPGYLLNRDSLLLITLFLIAFCIKSMMAYGLHHAQYKFIYTVASRLSESRLLHYLEGSYMNYVTVDSSVFIRQISQQPVEFSQHVLAGVQQVFTQSFLIIMTSAAILVFNAKLFLVVLLLLVPPVIAVALFIKKRTRAARKNVKKSGEKTLQQIKEALASFIESNVYDKKMFFVKKYTDHQNELNRHLSDLQVVQGIPGRLMEVFAVFGFFVLLLITKWNHVSGQTGPESGVVDVLTIGMFMAAAYKIMPGLVKILNSLGQVRTYDYTIMDLSGQEKEIPTTSSAFDPIPIQSIEFRNIGFSYNNHQPITGFSCLLNKGEFTGISGISGRGKTTLVNLMLGFVKPQEGMILINGEKIETSDLKQFWQRISYVKQEPFLINDTILKNIILDNRVHNAKKLDETLKATGLLEWISHYPEGVNKCITENGKDISGGQRQRIAIARALYKDADLVILDEPFNDLDRHSETEFLEHFSNMARQGKMILLITHNKESLAHCHKIISLDES